MLELSLCKLQSETLQLFHVVILFAGVDVPYLIKVYGADMGNASWPSSIGFCLCCRDGVLGYQSVCLRYCQCCKDYVLFGVCIVFVQKFLAENRELEGPGFKSCGLS
jgi:hypothetical protein